MAAYAKHISFLFLLVLFSINQVQARESKFFSKVTHVSESEVPLLEAPAPAPEAAQPTERGYGYGLYGHGSSQFPNTKTMTTTTTTTIPATTIDENEILNEELASESYKESETGYTTTSTNGYTNSNYNTNGYTNSNYNTNGYTNSNYNNNGYYPSNYNNNAYETERQGMSDTRFVENGKYYYDAKNENTYLNGYESGKGNTQNEVYYGNNVNSNEFNSMEEYQSQEENQENQEKYEP